MVTYFNRKDLVSFGSYLLSEKRKARFQTMYDNDLLAMPQKPEIGSVFPRPLTVEDRLKDVHHSDVENWLEELNKED